MGQPPEWLGELTRRAGIPAAGSTAAGIATWLAAGHDSLATAIAAVAAGGLAASLPKIFESVYKRRPANIKAKGEARAKVIDAGTRRIRADVQKIKAKSEAKCAARRANAEARNSAKRADVEAEMLRLALRSGKVGDAIALLTQQKSTALPGKDNGTEPPGDGKQNVRPIRPLGCRKGRI
jgi:hypothetical protein